MIGFDGASLKVLVIEDNQHFRLLLRTILEAVGVKTICEAMDGVHGLEVLSGCAADLVILDWKMAPMDGVTFAHKLRHGGSACANVPIIMVTGYGTDRVVAEARKAGIDEFLEKPISAQTLVEAMRNVLAQPRSSFVAHEACTGQALLGGNTAADQE